MNGDEPRICSLPAPNTTNPTSAMRPVKFIPELVCSLVLKPVLKSVPESVPESVPKYVFASVRPTRSESAVFGIVFSTFSP